MLKKTMFCFLVLIALAGFCLAQTDSGQVVQVEPLQPAPSGETGVMTDETPSLWFVELSSPPTADGASLTTVKAQKDAFRAYARQTGLQYKERFAFNTLWNGFSVSIPPSELGKLRTMPGVKAIYPMDIIRVPETTPSDPELWTSLAMIGADIAQSELGYTGKGINVAVVDTGIDYDHKALGGDGVARSNSTVFPTSRVITGWDFVGDAFNADPASPAYDPDPVPDPYPDDCAGHGTHVSGIIGANDPTNGLNGVAPEVNFGAYRVFGCAGSTTGDIMIAAMERALADGMQVLNMSIGSAYQWPQYPTAMAANRLVNKGVVVVASIGNNGANGLYSAGAPGVGEKVIGVASFDNVALALNYFTISPDDTKIGFTPATGSPLPPTSGTYPMARTGTATTTNDACSALPAGSLAGKVALIRRGTCSFYQKAFNAQSAGAIGVVLYNNASGRVSPTVAGSPPITIPVVAVSDTEGGLIDSRLAVGPVSLTLTDQISFFPNPQTGNLISSFSSYGLSPDLALKPDIGAPGGYIWSTFPLELGGYASLSGTSMASPHVAGAAALLLQAKPKTKAEAVRGILQNSAVPKPWWGNPALGFLDNVSRQGAGMLQIDKAILSTTVITPAKVSTGESQAGPYVQKFTITNSSSAAVTYNLSSVNALSVANTFSPGFYTSNASVAFSAPSVTVPANKTATVTATINPATGPDKAQYGGYIKLTPQGGGEPLRVPFAGFVGDYQSIQALAPTPYGFPWLAVLIGGSYYQVTGPDDWVYSMTGVDVPYILVHLDHHVRQLQVTVFDEAGDPLHPVFSDAFSEDYIGRNSTSTGFFALAWDGTRIQSNGYNGVGYTKYFTKPVPNGQYRLVVKALKALGNPSNPADWETWTSPVVAIARP